MASGEEHGQQSLGAFLLRGGGLTVLARLLAVAAGLLVQVLLARLVSPEELGAYFLTQSIAASVAIVAQLGLPRVLVRELARATGAGQRGLASRILAKTVSLVLVGVAATAGAYALLIGPWLGTRVFDSQYVAAASLIVAAWIAGMAIQNVLAESLRGLHRVGAAAFFGGPVSSVVTAGLLALVLVRTGGSSLGDVLAISVAATAVSVVCGAIAVVRDIRIEPESDTVGSAALLRGAGAMLLVGLGTNVIAQSDLWIVGSRLGEDDVALYGAAKRLIRLVSLPMVVVSLVVPPLIADLYAKGETARLERAIRGTTMIASLPSFAVLAFFITASGPILTWVFGAYYAQAAGVVAVLSVERVAFVWAGPTAMALMMTGNDRPMLLVTFLAGAVQIAATWVGAMTGGILGAGIGFLFGSLLRTVVLWDQARRATGLRTDLSVRDLGRSLALVRTSLRGRRGAGPGS